jgi:hypothetical protein
MRVDHIKFGRLERYSLEEGRLRHDWIAPRAAKSKRARARGYQSCAGSGVAACEQRHIVTKFHQLVYEPSNNAFGAAIKFRRNAFGKWGNLCNPHRTQIQPTSCPSVRY